MKAAATTIGILGSIVAFLASIVAIAAGYFLDVLPLLSGGSIMGIGLLALIGSVVALVGGIMSATKPLAGSILLVVASVVTIIALAVVYKDWTPLTLLGGLSLALLLIGAILAFLGWMESRKTA